MQVVWIITSCVWILLLAAGAVAQDCSGHGHLDDSGKCVCDKPWPAEGEIGGSWAGVNCSIPVFGRGARRDMTAVCGSAGCSSLEADGWVCFAVPLPKLEQQAWNYLTIQLNRTSTDSKGDPDLFGLWTGGSRSTAVPHRSGKGFDFQDTSSNLHPLITKKVKRSDFDGFDYDGVYLCVRAYGSVPANFALRASIEACPSDFDAAGDVLVCKTRADAPEAERRYSECTATGECVCTGPYAKPVPEVFPGLGFEDCSATVNKMQLSPSSSFVLEHEGVDPDAWRFYRFAIEPEDFQVVVNVAEEQAKGSLGMYVKTGVPPGSSVRQYDLVADWNAVLGSKQLEVSLDRSHPQFRTGAWFVGVVGDYEPATYTISVHKYDCAQNCSGHGQCVHGDAPEDRHCDCSEGYGGSDCSKMSQPLEYDARVEGTAAGSQEFVFYALPSPSEHMLAGNVELLVEASFTSEGYGHWLDARPAILLQQGDASTYPSTTSYAYKLVLEEQDTKRTLRLCPSQLSGGGEWKLAVYNPMRLHGIRYSLLITKVGRCLNNCSSHGTCNTDGVCECHDSWTGGDCSVSSNATCVPKSRRGLPKPDNHGICWQECDCNDAGEDCKFGDSCVDFTCDAAEQGLPYRRMAKEDACVQDQCSRRVVLHAGCWL